MSLIFLQQTHNIYPCTFLTNLRKAVHPFRLLRNDKFFDAYLLLLFVLSPAAFK